MDFEDILKQWSMGDGKKTSPTNDKRKIKNKNSTAGVSMDSLLDLYPPNDDSCSGEVEKPTVRQKRRNYRRMAPQERLDLHGFSVVSGIIELEDFIARCKRRRIEKILIIHGKGLHSPNGDGVLRESVISYLHDSPNIGEIGHPSEKEGGAGASWAIIKY